jgi:hypothetical protein
MQRNEKSIYNDFFTDSNNLEFFIDSSNKLSPQFLKHASDSNISISKVMGIMNFFAVSMINVVLILMMFLSGLKHESMYFSMIEEFGAAIYMDIL